MQNEKLPFLRHLEELRTRLIISFIFFLAGTCFVYINMPKILPILLKPAGKLVFLDPLEAFNSYITLSVYGGAAISSPFIFYQIFSFVFPGLSRKEKKYILTATIASLFLFASGCAAGYLIALPIILKFLLSFSSESIFPMLTIGKYVSFASGITAICGAVFELPLVIIILTKIGIIQPQSLAKRRREIIVLSFIISAIITPTTDIANQALFAVLLWLFSEIGIALAQWLFSPRQNSLQA